MLLAVIGTFGAASQNDMTTRVSRRFHDSSKTYYFVNIVAGPGSMFRDVPFSVTPRKV